MPARPSGLACRDCPGPRRAIVGRAIAVPRAGGTAQGTARGTSGHQDKVVPGPQDGPVAGLYFFLISMLYFLPGHLEWMDGPTGLHFLFLELIGYIFYWAIKHRAIGPCLSRATGHGGSAGTAQAVSDRAL